MGCVHRAALSLLSPHPSAGGAGAWVAGWGDGLAEQEARCEWDELADALPALLMFVTWEQNLSMFFQTKF